MIKFNKAAFDGLWSKYSQLAIPNRTVFRMKALIGSYTNKTSFLHAMTASNTMGPDGKPWIGKTLNPVLTALVAQGLLNEDLSCTELLLHPVAAEAADSPEGSVLLKAISLAYSSNGRFRNDYNYSMQTDADAVRTLRLTIYFNNEAEYCRLSDIYNKEYSANRGEHLLEKLFLDINLGMDWLSSRKIIIQAHLFFLKLHHLLDTGRPVVDLAPLLVHYLRQQEEPGYEIFQTNLLAYDILSGNLVSAQAKTIKMQGYLSLANQGAIDFLAGKNAQALAHFEEALKLYKKEIGRRKIFLKGKFGLFFLMAMFRANDSALYPTMQTHLDIAISEGESTAFLTLQALLWMMQGMEAKARVSLAALRVNMPAEPLSAACVVLAEWLVTPDIALKNKTDTARRFAQLETILPLVARIHAEVLLHLTKGAVYEAYLKASNSIDFCGIITVREPWERVMENLSVFLGTGQALSSQAAPTAGKRLVWFLNPVNCGLEALEQSPKGRDGWTPGRSVAMKRFYEKDPSLDYLTDQDRRVLLTMEMETHGWYNEKNYYFDSYKALPALIGHPLVFHALHREQRLGLVPYPVELIVKEQSNGYRISLSHSADKPSIFLEPETPTRYRVIDVSARILALQDILGKSGLTVPNRAREQVVAMVLGSSTLPIRADIAAVDLPALPGDATPTLQLQPYEEGLKVNLVVRPFGAEGPFYLAGTGGQSLLAMIKGRQLRVNRDIESETSEAGRLVSACPTLLRLSEHSHEWLLPNVESSLELLLELKNNPHPIRIEWPEGERLKVSAPVSAKRLMLKLDRVNDWFHMEGTLQVDEELVLDMQDLLERLKLAHGRFIRLADGSFLALTREFQKQLERLRGVAEADKKGIRLPLLGSLAVTDLMEDAGTVKADRKWKEFAARLTAAGVHQPVIPSTLQAELRDYQVEGFVWLSRLAFWGAGACLADDMGLGKTLQAIAVMLEQGVKGPILVVAPTSVCHNWAAELNRFAPTLRVHRLSEAGDRAGLIGGSGAMEVLITSYGLLNQEIEQLAAIRWQMLVLDEAQAVKNATTQRFQSGQKLQAAFRLILTGTPIENYLEELWSLFAIINPGLLGSRESFQRRFANPIERERNDAALQTLRALIRPFILRRTKNAVLAELPPCTELTLEIELPLEERAFYEALRRKALESLAGLEADNAGQKRIHILAEITRLRRCCCHPCLVAPETGLPGAKLQTFLELVAELICNRHKALVFSQFVGQLERVRAALDAQNICYQYLDGSTPAKDREKRVMAFQAGEGDLFLISLRAGGAGLNLTAADYVIHLDPWWNPAVEDQASARAHRIGQERPVTVYRLIVQDSIEEKILALHQHKRDLASDLLEGSELSGRLSEDDLLDLIRL